MGLFNWFKRREAKEHAKIHLEHIQQCVDEIQDQQVVNVLTKSGSYTLTHTTTYVSQVDKTIIIDRVTTEWPILVDQFEIAVYIDQEYPTSLIIPIGDIVDIY